MHWFNSSICPLPLFFHRCFRPGPTDRRNSLPCPSAGDTGMGFTRCSGKEMIPAAIFHGLLIDLSVPFFVSFFCKQ